MSDTSILIVEDESIVAENLRIKLEQLGYTVAGVASAGEEAYEMALEQRPQLILMDIQLSGAQDGIQTAGMIQNQLEVPVVYLTAHSDSATLARAKLTGPFGYILKPFELRDLAVQIELALYKYAADAEVREQREWLRVTLTSIGDAVIAVDAEECITFVNPAAETLTGWKNREAMGRPVGEVFRIINEHTGRSIGNPVAQVLREVRTVPLANHTAIVTKDGRTVPIEDSAAPIKDSAGRCIGVVLVFHDVTEKRRAREALLESEEKFRTAFNTSPCIMVISTLDDGRIIEVNEAFEKLMGYSRDEVLAGLTAMEIGIWADPGNRRRQMDLLLANGSIENVESTVRSKNGQTKTLMLSARMISHRGQRHILATWMDITEQRCSENNLVETSKRLELATKAANIGIWDWDIKANRLIWDDRMLEMYGETSATFSGAVSAWRDKILPDDRDKTWESCQAALRGDSAWAAEFRVLGKGGATTHIKADGMVIRNAAGESVRMLGTNYDITARKRAELELQELMQGLEQRVVERTALAESRSKQLQALAVELIEAEERERRRVADLLHDDLQQILAAARLQLDSICDAACDDPVLPNVLKLLSESIEKSRRLSHELSPPVLQHSDLTEALQWTARFFNEQFGLHTEIKAATTQKLENSPLKVFLFRALQELLFNVVKHSGVHSARVDLARKDGSLLLTVSDQGLGFDPKTLDSASTSTGLGLLSLRERASYIGGRLSIESAPGRGSRISVTVPCCIAEKEMHYLNNTKKTSIATAGSIQDVHSDAIHVLFVDDHKVMRRGLMNLVGDQPGIRVAGEASNGLEAVECVERLEPDVVVMDVSMPVMDGIEATRRIKAAMPDVRVVGLSMHLEDSIVQAMCEAGAEAFVSKTASMTELLKAIYGNKGTHSQ